MENLTTTTPMILCLDADHFSLPLDPVQPADMEGLGYNLHSSSNTRVFDLTSYYPSMNVPVNRGGAFLRGKMEVAL